MHKRLGKFLAPLLLVVVVFFGGGAAFATDSASTHYSLSGGSFSSSAADTKCSTSYCATAALGQTSSGASESTSYSKNTGAVTDSQPSLNVVVSSSMSDLGTFSSTATTTHTMTAKITSYLSSGYTVQMYGSPPKIKGHTIAALTSPTASQKGTEQFGINVVANTSPDVGANLVQVPDSTTSFGQVNDGYNTPNKFKYVSGDVIAHSNKSSGETDYTISMIINVSNETPAGHYTSDYSVVVIPVY